METNKPNQKEQTDFVKDFEKKLSSSPEAIRKRNYRWKKMQKMENVNTDEKFKKFKTNQIRKRQTNEPRISKQTPETILEGLRYDAMLEKQKIKLLNNENMVVTPKDFIVVGAVAGQGKTTFLTNNILCFINSQISTYLEDKTKPLKFCSAILNESTSADVNKILLKSLIVSNKFSFDDAVDFVSKTVHLLDISRTFSPSDSGALAKELNYVINYIRQESQDEDCMAIFLDYTQNLKSETGTENKQYMFHRQFAEQMDTIKNTSNAPIFAFTQLRPANKERKDFASRVFEGGTDLKAHATLVLEIEAIKPVNLTIITIDKARYIQELKLNLYLDPETKIYSEWNDMQKDLYLEHLAKLEWEEEQRAKKIKEFKNKLAGRISADEILNKKE